MDIKFFLKVILSEALIIPVNESPTYTTSESTYFFYFERVGITPPVWARNYFWETNIVDWRVSAIIYCM